MLAGIASPQQSKYKNLNYSTITFGNSTKIVYKGLKADVLNQNVLDNFSESLSDYYREKYNFIKQKPIQVMAKRAFDIVGGLVLSALSFPIIAIAGVAIKLDSKGSIFFKQIRIGKDRKPFVVHKLRTMSDGKVTRVGKILRKYSIDELPQSFDILKGDMSFVGPRPLTSRDTNRLIRHNPHSLRRFAVPSGAVIKYSDIKAQNDAIRILDEKKYLDGWSFKKDLGVLFWGVKKIVKGNNC